MIDLCWQLADNYYIMHLGEGRSGAPLLFARANKRGRLFLPHFYPIPEFTQNLRRKFEKSLFDPDILRTFAPAFRIEGNAGVRPLNVRCRRFSRTLKAPRGHCLGGRSFCKKVPLMLRGVPLIIASVVIKVSDLPRKSVGFTFVIVQFLPLLNFLKCCGCLNADSRDLLYICRRRSQ